MPSHTQAERRKNKRSSKGNATTRTSKAASSASSKLRRTSDRLRGDIISSGLGKSLLESNVRRNPTSPEGIKAKRLLVKLKANRELIGSLQKKASKAIAAKKAAKETSVATKKKASRAQKSRRSNIGKKKK